LALLRKRGIKSSTRDINSVKKLIYRLTGNTLGETKEVMIKNRLEKIGHKIGIYDSSELLSAINEGKFLEEFVNTFTTNKTEFFRESFYFEDMISRVFPSHFAKNDSISMYSCASSSGEEVYSMAISFEYYKKISKKIHIKADVLATYIDTDMLKKATQ